MLPTDHIAIVVFDEYDDTDADYFLNNTFDDSLQLSKMFSLIEFLLLCYGQRSLVF